MSQELIPANRQRQAQLVRGSVLPLLAQTPGVTKAAVRAVRGLLESYGDYSQRSTNLSSQSTNGGNMPGNVTRRKKPRSKPGKNSQNVGKNDRATNLAPIYRGVTEDSITGTYVDFYDLTCDASGTIFSSLEISMVPPTGSPSASIASIVSRIGTIGAAYRQFKINWLKVSYFSLLPSTTGGFLALGIDPQPCIGSPGSQSAVIRHTGSVMGDIKDEYTVLYKPARAGKTGLKYINQTATPSSPDELSYGVIQGYGKVIGGTAGMLAGKVRLEVNITFAGAT